jgi:hypothetical protein
VVARVTGDWIIQDKEGQRAGKGEEVRHCISVPRWIFPGLTFCLSWNAELALIFSLCCWRGVSEWNDETDPLSNVGKGDSQSAGSSKGKGFS